jgi:hypothetical protein
LVRIISLDTPVILIAAFKICKLEKAALCGMAFCSLWQMRKGKKLKLSSTVLKTTKCIHKFFISD